MQLLSSSDNSLLCAIFRGLLPKDDCDSQCAQDAHQRKREGAGVAPDTDGHSGQGAGKEEGDVGKGGEDAQSRARLLIATRLTASTPKAGKTSEKPKPVIAAAAKAIHGEGGEPKQEQAHGFEREQAMATGTAKAADGLDEEKARRDKSQSERGEQRAAARPVAAQVKESDESGQYAVAHAAQRQAHAVWAHAAQYVAEGKMLARELQGRTLAVGQGEG